jgi:cytochrome c peroxidase
MWGLLQVRTALYATFTKLIAPRECLSSVAPTDNACGIVWSLAFRAQPGHSESYVRSLPKGFPKPRVPRGNPMTEAKVELGKHLFYDTRMSVNGKASCATCHKQELAFTDGRTHSRRRYIC